MELNDYQNQARPFAHYPAPSPGVAKLYCATALAGEVGEVCDEIKKMWRNDDGTLTEKRRDKVLYELGDALWYLSALAGECGLTLDEIARVNIAKLTGRHPELAPNT